MTKKLYNLLQKLNPRYKRFIKYNIVGGIGAVIDISALILLVELFKVPIVIANTISFSLAILNNFLLNKVWTFRNKEKKYLKQFSKFILIAFVGLIFNTILMQIAVIITTHYLFAKIVIIFIIGAWNYFTNKYWTFN